MTSASEQTPAQLPALPTLPSADDSSWASAFGSGDKRLLRLRGYLDAGRRVWWRREPFRGTTFREVEPKWHVFVSRVRSADPENRWSFTWQALCGYENTDSEILSGLRDFKARAPQKDTRCRNCENTIRAMKTTAVAAAVVTHEAAPEGSEIPAD